MSIRLFVRSFVGMEQLSSHERIFVKFDIWVFFESLSRNVKFHYNMMGITGTSHEDPYTFVITSLLVLIMRVVSDKSCRENQDTHLMFNNVFFFKNRAVYEIMWKNIVQPERPQMKIWRMRVTSWTPGATDTCTLRCLHQECYCESQMRLMCDKDALETVQNEFKLQSLGQKSAPDVLNSQLISGRFREAMFTSTSHNSYVHYCFASCLILSSGKVYTNVCACASEKSNSVFNFTPIKDILVFRTLFPITEPLYTC